MSFKTKFKPYNINKINKILSLQPNKFIAMNILPMARQTSYLELRRAGQDETSIFTHNAKSRICRKSSLRG